MADYILLQDGSGQITLQDGSGQILLQSDGAVASVDHTSGFLGRTLGGTQYRRRPQLLWHDDDGLSVVPDTGGSIQVLRSFEQWSLARASRYLYRGTAQDFNAPAPAEADTLAQFLVRVPFRRLGRSPYLFHQDYESVPPEPEVETLAPFLIRVPFKVLGRTPYLFNTAQDFDTPVTDTGSTFQAGRSLAQWNWARAARFSYWNTTQDFDAPAGSVEADTWTPRLITRDLAIKYSARAARLGFAFPQDNDAPPVVEVLGGTFIPTFRTRRGR